MIASIELQVISKILTCDDAEVIDTLCNFDESYYSVFKPQIKYILDHRARYNTIPDVFTFQAEFPDVTLVTVNEPLDYLITHINKNKQHILLIETFNRLKDLGSGDVSEAWEYLTNQCERALSLDQTDPLDIIKDAESRAKQVKEFSRQARIPTGFPEIDKLMYGGFSTVEELVILLARTNSGKAQPLWSRVLTPNGWTTMGNIKVGDTIVGKHNDNGKVVSIFPQGVKDYYRVHFNDGTFVECCDDHLWEVLDRQGRRRDSKQYGKFKILTTNEIRNSLSKKYSVDISAPVQFDIPFDRTNELNGYLLGVILGDGCLRKNTITITNADIPIWDKIIPIVDSYGCQFTGKLHNSITGKVYGHNFVRQKMVEYGLMDKLSVDKHIPKQFLTAPIDVRLDLLAGLMDTDGWAIDGSPRWEFCTASKQLANDFVELARSLGVHTTMYASKPSWYTKNGKRISAHGKIRISCRSEFNPFYLPRKANRYQYREGTINRSALKRNCKMIKSVELVGQTECQCILLDNKSHTYITDNYTVTHNTWFCTKLMETAQKNGFPVLYYSPEMQAAFLGTRFDTWRSHFQNSQLYQGNYDEAYNNYIKELATQDTSAFILEDKDMPSGTVNTRGLENLVRRHKIKLVIVDGLSYMEDSKHGDTDYVRYKNMCLDLFKMSKRYGCVVVIAMQANRETRETKDDKGDPFPNLYNIEGSDHPARICTQAFALRQVFDKHVLDIRLEKSRTANNQKPILSYAWDVNTGNMQYLPGGVDDFTPAMNTPHVDIPNAIDSNPTESNDIDLSDSDDVEF